MGGHVACSSAPLERERIHSSQQIISNEPHRIEEADYCQYSG